MLSLMHMATFLCSFHRRGYAPAMLHKPWRECSKRGPFALESRSNSSISGQHPVKEQTFPTITNSRTAPTKLKVHKAGRQEVRGVSSPGFLGLWRCTSRVPSRTQRYVRVRAKAPASLQAAARLVELQAGGLERMPSSRFHDLWHSR